MHFGARARSGRTGWECKILLGRLIFRNGAFDFRSGCKEMERDQRDCKIFKSG